MEKQIKAVFFDIGGTLVMKKKHTEIDLSIISEMMRLLGDNAEAVVFQHLIREKEEEYKNWTRATLAEMSIEDRWAFILGSRYPVEQVRQCALQLQTLWGKSKGEKQLYPETAPVLQELARRGYLLGTISHTSPRFLEGSGVSHLFATVIHASKFGRRKPHPSLFLAAARECGVSPAECLYVGDRPTRDVIGSREAGMGKVIVVSRNETSAELENVPMRPDHTLRDLEGLLDLLPGVDHKSFSRREDPRYLYDAALSTMWGIREDKSLAGFFEKGRKLDFARFELNHNVSPEMFAELDQNHFHVGSVHDPCPASIPAKELDKRDWLISALDDSNRVKGVDVVKRSIELAVHLCSALVVIHPGRVVGDHHLDRSLRELYRNGQCETPEYTDLLTRLVRDRRERGLPHLDSLLKSTEELTAFCQNSGVRMGFENRLYYYEMPIFEEIETLLDTFDVPHLGWQYDVGHLQIHHVLGLTDRQTWLEEFKDRIVGVHLHDVKGIEDHLAPGQGDVDFSKISLYLPPYCVKTLEVNAKVAAHDIRSGMETLVTAGCVSRI